MFLFSLLFYFINIHLIISIFVYENSKSVWESIIDLIIFSYFKKRMEVFPYMLSSKGKLMEKAKKDYFQQRPRKYLVFSSKTFTRTFFQMWRMETMISGFFFKGISRKILFLSFSFSLCARLLVAGAYQVYFIFFFFFYLSEHWCRVCWVLA